MKTNNNFTLALQKIVRDDILPQIYPIKIRQCPLVIKGFNTPAKVPQTIQHKVIYTRGYSAHVIKQT